MKRPNDEVRSEEQFASLSSALVSHVEEVIAKGILESEEAAAQQPNAWRRPPPSVTAISAAVDKHVLSIKAAVSSFQAQQTGRPVLRSHVKHLKAQFAGDEKALAGFDYLLSVTKFEDGGEERHEIKSYVSDQFLSVRVRIGERCRLLFCSQENNMVSLLRCFWIAFSDSGDSFLCSRTLSDDELQSASARATIFHIDGEQVQTKKLFSEGNFEGEMWTQLRSLICPSSSSAALDGLSNKQLAMFIVAALDARPFCDEELEGDEGGEVGIENWPGRIINGKAGLCKIPLPI